VKECWLCGASFAKHPKESRKQWAGRRFCTRRCAAEYTAEQRPPAAVRQCEECSKSTKTIIDGLCKSCWSKRRYRRQRARLLTLNRRWREANPDYFRQPHIVERNRRWQDANRDRVREINRAAKRRRRARIHAAPVGDSAQGREYAAILGNDPCSYCGGSGGVIDHIVAIARGGGDAWENLTSACSTCNVRKYSESLLEFLLWRSQRPQTGQGAAPARL
jgi:5-methylcytosine-specific restriction endonuclease McrA